MKSKHADGAVVFCCVAFFALVPLLCAQDAIAPQHNGVTQDWSDRQIVFSLDGLERHPEMLYREPRILHQAMQRWQVPDFGTFQSADPLSDTVSKPESGSDWSVAALGGRLLLNSFPAKFSFNPGATPSCTGDYVVFGLNTAGVTGGAANLVAFNNLYAGTGGLCGSAPTVVFAYNTTTHTGGKVVTSPVISEDGTKIAFVESASAPSASTIFHVLTWTAGNGVIGNAAAPAAMTSLTLSSTTDDTASAPWVDYAGDAAYVGSDNGLIYKITGVFHGTPALAGSPWPITVSANLHLTPPVLDSHLGMLMVGSANGNLYRINTATGALATLIVGSGSSAGIVAPPIVDVTNGTTFVVDSNDGTSGVLVEVATATMLQVAKARIGEAAASGTAIHLYQPAFSNAYYTKPSTGVIRVCGTGTADTTPWQYAFGFGGTGGTTMQTTASFSQQLLTTAAVQCTGWTEFYNPNVNGGTDFFFFGLTSACTATGAAGGCVAEITGSNTTPVTTTVDGGASGIVIDNYSTAAQASSIYLTALSVNTAYKFTQNGLH